MLIQTLKTQMWKFFVQKSRLINISQKKIEVKNFYCYQLSTSMFLLIVQSFLLV